MIRQRLNGTNMTVGPWPTARTGAKFHHVAPSWPIEQYLVISTVMSVASDDERAAGDEVEQWLRPVQVGDGGAPRHREQERQPAGHGGPRRGHRRHGAGLGLNLAAHAEPRYA